LAARSLALAVIAAAWSGAAWPDPARGANPPDLASGQEIFEEYCAACHGYDGIRIIPQAPNFSDGESLEQDAALLLTSIRDGKGEIMPLWSNDLSDQQMLDVLAYIMTLRRPE
jgi:mono/diheme cytochrome c family protein